MVGYGATRLIHPTNSRRSHPHRPRPKPCLFHDHIATEQTLPEPRDRRVKPLLLERVHGRIDPQQNNAGRPPAMPIHQIAEVLVLGQQQASFAPRERHYLGIDCCRSDLRHVNHIVPAGTQPRDQRGIDAFVGQPPHGSAVHQVFVGKIVCGKGLRRQHVLARQTRMVGEDGI